MCPAPDPAPGLDVVVRGVGRFPKLFGKTTLKLDAAFGLIVVDASSSVDFGSSGLKPGGSNADTSANFILPKMLSGLDSTLVLSSLNL